MYLTKFGGVDITELLEEPEDMCLCPLCDQPIMMGESTLIGMAYGCGSLIHEFCYENLMYDDA